MEFTLLWAALIPFGFIYAMLYWEAPRGNAAVTCARSLWDIALIAAVTGLVVGRVWSLVADGGNPFTRPGDLIIVRAGVATGPAAAAAVASLLWTARGHVAEVADALAPAALAGLAGWHAGCIVRNACLGTASDLPWALAQDGSTVTRHPVEAYAVIGFIAIAMTLVIWKQYWKRPAPGVLGGIALMAAGAIRLATEPFRPSLGGGPVWWYAAAIVVGVAIVLVAATRSSGSHQRASVHSGE